MSKQSKCILCLILVFLCFTPRSSIADRNVEAQGEMPVILATAYSTAAAKYATFHVDRSLRIWDATTDEILHTIQVPDPRVSPGEQTRLGLMAFSPSGDRLALCYYGEASMLLVVDAITGQTVLELRPGASIVAVDWSPDGESFGGVYQYSPFTPGPDGYLILWDAWTGAELQRTNLGDPSIAFDWHPTAPKLAFGIPDFSYAVVVWDVTQWGPLFEVPAESVTSIAWQPDGDMFATISQKRDLTAILRTWDGTTGELQLELDTGYSGLHLSTVFWSEDGRWVGVHAEKRITIWDGESGALIFSREANDYVSMGVTMFADGRILFAFSNSLETWDTGLVDLPNRAG